MTVQNKKVSPIGSGIMKVIQKKRERERRKDLMEGGNYSLKHSLNKTL